MAQTNKQLTNPKDVQIASITCMLEAVMQGVLSAFQSQCALCSPTTMARREILPLTNLLKNEA